MKNILAFAGSNNSTSINNILLKHIAARIQGHNVKIVNLTDYDFPMYDIDHEKEKGFPVNVQVIQNLIKESDALIIAVNEHNGTVSAYFKNFVDWLSRVDRNFLAGKKILLISTSNGARGAASALDYAKGIFPRFGGHVVESFSFPSFKDNFESDVVLNEILELGIADVLTTFAHEIEE